MNIDRNLPRKLRRQSSSSHFVDDCCWNGFGRPVLYFILFLLACWSLAYQSTGLTLCSSPGNYTQQQQSPNVDENTSEESITAASVGGLRSRNAHSHHPAISKEFIRSLFDKWNDALLTGDSDRVAQLYADHATLLPTLSNIPRNDYESIKDYFDKFLQRQPHGRIVEGFVQLGDDGTWAQDNGIYEFTMGIDSTVVRARYSFVYQLLEEDEQKAEWKIVHHHSSLMPEQ
jgi:uncharacterized protein (TIGR02246 family)